MFILILFSTGVFPDIVAAGVTIQYTGYQGEYLLCLLCDYDLHLSPIKVSVYQIDTMHDDAIRREGMFEHR